jgi:hypothetical protein
MNEAFNELVQAAIRIRYAVYQAGGMATKSGVEDVLMHRYAVERDIAHDVMNHIEYHDLDSLRCWRGEGDAPTLAEYPEIALVGPNKRIFIAEVVA